jgi:hypothetical protein
MSYFLTSTEGFAVIIGRHVYGFWDNEQDCELRWESFEGFKIKDKEEGFLKTYFCGGEGGEFGYSATGDGGGAGYGDSWGDSWLDNWGL